MLFKRLNLVEQYTTYRKFVIFAGVSLFHIKQDELNKDCSMWLCVNVIIAMNTVGIRSRVPRGKYHTPVTVNMYFTIRICEWKTLIIINSKRKELFVENEDN